MLHEGFLIARENADEIRDIFYKKPPFLQKKETKKDKNKFTFPHPNCAIYAQMYIVANANNCRNKRGKGSLHEPYNIQIYRWKMSNLLQ